MVKKHNFSKRKKKVSVGRKKKNTAAGGIYYVKKEDRKKETKSPPSTTTITVTTTSDTTHAIASSATTVVTSPSFRSSLRRTDTPTTGTTTTTTTNTNNITPPSENRPYRKAREDCVEKLSKGGDVIDATDMFKDDTVEPINLAIAIRWAIAHIYTVVLGSPPEFDPDACPLKEQWTGQSGTFAEIRRLMPGWKEQEDTAVTKLIAKGKHNEDQARKQHRNNKHKQIKRVVECIDLCKSLGEKFDGEIRWAGGR